MSTKALNSRFTVRRTLRALLALSIALGGVSARAADLTRLPAGMVSGLSGPPNLWYNPCADFDQRYEGLEQPVYNSGLSVYDPDRVNVQQVTPTPHVSVVRSNDGAGGCGHSIKITNGFNAAGSSNTVGTGSHTFSLRPGLNFVAGETVTAVESSNLSNSMTGTVTSYTAATGVLVLNVTATTGSGTYSDWTVGTAGTTNRAPLIDTATATAAAGQNVITVASTTPYFVGSGIRDHYGDTIIPVNSFVTKLLSSTQIAISGNLIGSGFASGQAFESYGDNGVFAFENIATDDAGSFLFGTPSARPSTIAFYVRGFGPGGVGTASLAFYGYTSVSTLGRSLVEPFPITTSWQPVELHIPPDTVGNGATWAIPNSYGGLWGAIGMTLESQGGTTCPLIPPNIWSNVFAVCGSTGHTLNLTGSVGSWVEITAVQVEVNPVATQFNPPTAREQLAELQTTYEKSYPQGTAPGSVLPFNGAFDTIYDVTSGSTIATKGKTVRFATKKRCPSPRISLYSPTTGAPAAARDFRSNVDVSASLLQPGSDDGFGWLASQATAAATFQVGTAWTAECAF